MLNSSKRVRLDRVAERIAAAQSRQAGGVETVTQLRALIEAQEASIEHLVTMRAEPEANRIKLCEPRESGERIFGDMALDLRIFEERQKLRQWRDELNQLVTHERNTAWRRR